MSSAAFVITDEFIYKQIRYQFAFLIAALVMVLLSFLVAEHDYSECESPQRSPYITIKQALILKILLTGFKSKDSITNASDIVVSSFIHDLPENLKSMSNNIVIEVINDNTHTVKQSLEEIVIKNKPSYCLFIGQAPGYNRITLESIATNYRFIAPPLKTGAPPQGDFIEETGDAAYMATLGNLQEMVECIKNIGIPASVSNHCGNSLCNQILYHGLHYAQMNEPGMKCGFLHIPALPEQILTQWPQHPFMPLAMSRMAIEIVVNYIYLQHARNGD